MNKIFKIIITAPAKVVVALIGLYQLALSPDHSWIKHSFPNGYCRHYPSCSEYGKQAVEKFGLLKGGWLAIARVARCHPWAEPSVDPLPKT